jgi:uncharacterized repeat protein (TIGR02543 family)
VTTNIKKSIIKISCLLPCLCTLALWHCFKTPDYATLTVNASPIEYGSVSSDPDWKNSQEYELGTKVTLTATPNKGYKFAGWAGDASGNTATITVTMNGDITVTAKFEQEDTDPEITDPEIPYTVTYYGNNNDNDNDYGTAPIDSQSPYSSGSEVTVLDAGDLARAGYTFNGWNTEANGSGDSYEANSKFYITGDIKLYAQWVVVIYDALIDTEMVFVKGWQFKMGCNAEDADAKCYEDETPQFLVTLSDYYIGKFEVTQRLWTAVMGNNPSHFKGDDTHPVENVSWDDAIDFIKRLNQRTSKSYRLPTEAEWEYAARGGIDGVSDNYKYAGSNTIDNVAWYNDVTQGTKTVGTKSANKLGIYDMSGNVWEWVSDFYSYGYSTGDKENPKGPDSGYQRVRRGGGYSDDAISCRVSNRGNNDPDNRTNNKGFRLALSP